MCCVFNFFFFWGAGGGGGGGDISHLQNNEIDWRVMNERAQQLKIMNQYTSGH